MSPGVLILIAALGVALLLFLVIKVRLQAFLALLIASLFVAIAAGIPLQEVPQTIQDGMGSTLGFIAIVVGIGTMFGEMLRVSGGAEQLATTLVNRFGETRAPWALGLTGFIVSIAVFFDVGLIILIPLVYSLTQRTGRSLLYYALPLAPGLAIGHSYIPQAANLSGPILGLITIAIASGATVLSHVNDSGFWLVSRYLGISEKNTLRSWTVLETILGGVGFLIVLTISLFI